MSDAYLPQIPALAAEIVHHLATEQYDRIRAARGPLTDLIADIKSYRADGFTIVDLPESAFGNFIVFEPNEFKDDWDVEFPLWTEEHGESDLQAYLTFRLEGDHLVGFLDHVRVP